MKPLLLTMITLALLAAPACALNEMTLVGQYEGEANDDRFGINMSMGDFDDDGCEEFIISASGWYENRGKVYYFDWNDDWPSEPAWTFQGTIENCRYGSPNGNVGDVSGDGIDDLGLVYHLGNFHRLDLLFGSADFDSVPDWDMWSEDLIINYGKSIDSCGDVNQDGGKDFIFNVYLNTDNVDEIRLYHGGAALDTIADWVDNSNYQYVSGLGDVNDDGYGDILLMDPNDKPPLLFFGGSPMDTIPDLIFYDRGFWDCGGGVGDVNGDGYNDFCIDLKMPDSTSSHGYVYFGGPDVDNWPDVILQNRLGELWGFTNDFSHGDFNGDGYSDIATGSGDLFFGRTVYIYLGSPWFNPVPDALVTDWSVSHGFGEAIAAGDVNGDGRDELLVAAPDYWFGSQQGRVYLYTGPEEWIDFGAGVDPEDIRHHPGWFILEQNYPNPFNTSTYIHFELGKPSTVNLTIYDLQCNRIKNLITSKDMLPGGYNVSWTGRNENNQPVSSGIYLLELRVDQYRQIRKMVLLR